MKALLALTQPPLLEGGAPGRCGVGLLRGLMAHGIEVRAIAARQRFAVTGEPPPDLAVEIVAEDPARHGPAWNLYRWRRPLSDLARGTFGARVREAARDADVLHLEEVETAWVDRGLGTPSLVHLHYLARRDRPMGAPWRREFRHALEQWLAERAAIDRHRFLVASSPLVADAIRARSPLAQVVVVPLTLDPDHYKPARLDGPPVAGLIGTAAWAPTAAAVHRLLGGIWPEVRRLAPDARLVISGRGMDRLVRDRRYPGVEVHGEVPSSAAFLRGLSILLYPIERGSGMKVKVLESMASGLPVVTTAAGAEGIEPNDGVIVEATAGGLAASAARLLLDERERRERGTAGLRMFEQSYAPRPATEPLVALYRQMAGEG